MDYNYKLNEFEGPLDLLLSLISKHEVEITEIPIFEITKQYIDYISKLEKFDIEVASEFIIMASELLEIKSKMLLPNLLFDNDEFNEITSDPRDELVNKLLEYKMFKNAANLLEERYNDFGRIYFKKQEDLTPFIKSIPLEEINRDLEKDLLVNAMKRILSNIDRTDNKRENYFEKVKRDAFTVEDKIVLIKGKLKIEKKFNFNSLFIGRIRKAEIIVTFMALLELLKLNIITVVQQYLFDDIIIESREG
jgi:segregation and condensation protein A